MKNARHPRRLRPVGLDVLGSGANPHAVLRWNLRGNLIDQLS